MENLKLKLGFVGVGLFALGAVVLSGAPSSNLLANLTNSADTVEEIETNQETIEETTEEETAPEEVVEEVEKEEPVLEPENEEVSTSITVESFADAQREIEKIIEEKKAEEEKERRVKEYAEKWDEILERYELLIKPIESIIPQEAYKKCKPSNYAPVNYDCADNLINGVVYDESITPLIDNIKTLKAQRNDALKSLNEEYSDVLDLNSI